MNDIMVETVAPLTLRQLKSLCDGVASDITMLVSLDVNDVDLKKRLQDDIKSKMNTLVDGWIAFRGS